MFLMLKSIKQPSPDSHQPDMKKAGLLQPAFEFSSRINDLLCRRCCAGAAVVQNCAQNDCANYSANYGCANSQATSQGGCGHC